MRARDLFRLLACYSMIFLAVGCEDIQRMSPGTEQISTNLGVNGRIETAVRVSPASKRDLLYVAGDGQSYVLLYPEGEIVGTILSGASGACSDASGNVFLTEGTAAVEYTHGSTTPRATLDLPGDTIGCAIDPATGNLAVTYTDYAKSNLAIFPNARGTPTTYTVDFETSYCGYDIDGNLFVDGITRSETFGLSELPAGRTSFTDLSVSPGISRLGGEVQWDGTYITVQGLNDGHESPVFYRLSVSGSRARVVSTIGLTREFGHVGRSWIYRRSLFMPLAHRGSSEARNVGLFEYPAGHVSKIIKGVGAKFSSLNGVTLSVGR